MNSISVDGPCLPSARAKSAMNMTAPLSTQTSRMPPSASAWSAETCFASSAIFSRICSSEMITCAMSASYHEPSAMRLSLPYEGCRSSNGAAVDAGQMPGYPRLPPSSPGDSTTVSDNSHKSLDDSNECVFPADDLDAARQVYRSLAVPVGDQRVERRHVSM